MTEIWKPIPDTLGRYEASSLGRVRSTNFHDGHRKVTGRVLKPHIYKKTGHAQIVLGLGAGNKKSRCVHVCVALAFHGPCPAGMEVLHKNHKPADNRPDNLKYGTRGENIMMDYANGV